MSKKKFRLDTYPNLYDRDLVVCYGDITFEELQKLYSQYDGSELGDDLRDHQAWCCVLTRKSDNTKILFVNIVPSFQDGFTSFGSDLLDMVNVASHEAIHCALDLFDMIGEKNIYNSEALAYLTGYFTECIMKTLLGK